LGAAAARELAPVGGVLPLFTGSLTNGSSRKLQRFAVRLDHPALWGIYASLEELRKKIMDAAKSAVPKSKVA
jgi:hypothetical protein